MQTNSITYDLINKHKHLKKLEIESLQHQVMSTITGQNFALDIFRSTAEELLLRNKLNVLMLRPKILASFNGFQVMVLLIHQIVELQRREIHWRFRTISLRLNPILFE